MEAFIEIVKILRRDCPWDKKQTHQSLSHLLIEESYEVVDAIASNNPKELADELGDLLLHVIMHSLIAEENNEFTFADVISNIRNKMIYRHPHVFSDAQVSNTDEVLDNWEKIKMNEGRKSALEGVPISLPSLLKAERIQEKASRVGFDWTDKNDVWAKVEEEFEELKTELKSQEKDNCRRKEEEFGDLIFAIVNAARFEKIVPEQALQKANNKFTRRFQYVENKAAENGLKLSEMTLEEMNQLWDEVKKIEK